MAEPKKIKVSLIAEEDENGARRLPYRILTELVRAHHSHLAEARIALAWQTGWSPDADGRLRLGQARKASDLDFALHQYDFCIVLNWEAWNAADFTRAQMDALLDHELCHCAITHDDEGEVKRDTSGRPVWRIRKHDIEEFTEIVARHGLWKGDLEKFAQVAMDKAALRGTLFGENPELAKFEDDGGPPLRDPAKPDNAAGGTPISADFANAVKKMVPKDGSVTIKTTHPGAHHLDKSVTFNAEDRDQIHANCDAAIAADHAGTPLTVKTIGPESSETPLVFRDAQHVHQTVAIADGLQTLGRVAPEAAKRIIRTVLGQTSEAEEMIASVVGMSAEDIDALVDRAIRTCIEISAQENGHVTAESLHRRLDLPLKRSLSLMAALQAGNFLTVKDGRLVSALTLNEWENVRNQTRREQAA